MQPVTRDIATKNRMAHAYRPGMGYVHVGELPMPPMGQRINQPGDCEALAVASSGSLHFLKPPKGADPMMMRWHPEQKEWEPMHVGAGKRVGFTAAYLAAHGWAYMGPVPVK